MEIDDYWRVPPIPQTQSPTNQDHGYIEHIGIAIAEKFENLAVSIKGQQFKGIIYEHIITGDPMPTFESVNLNEYNNYLNWLYYIGRKARRFEFLCIGLLGWTPGFTVPGVGFANIMEVSPFSAVSGGLATSHSCDWSVHGFDPRGLPRALTTPSCACSGMYMISERSASICGISEIMDVTITAENIVRFDLHPNKPLNPDNSGGNLWLLMSNLLGGYPTPRLHIPEADKKDPPQCIFSKRQQCSIFSSMRFVYPLLPMSSAVDDAGFMCTRMNELNQTELDGFQATAPRCNFDACRFYSPHVVSMPSALTLTNFLIGRGRYIRQITMSLPNREIGNVGHAGFWSLHDVPVFKTVQQSIETDISYSADGALSFDTGEVTSEGFTKYQTFAQIEAERGDGSDDIGLIGASAPTVSKQSPDGGLSPDNKGLLADSPALTIMRNMGIRRNGSVSMQELAAPSGSGDDDVQRAMHKAVYTSAAFTFPITEYFERFTVDSETRLQGFSELMGGLFPITGRSYDLIWQIPKFGDSVVDSREVIQKAVFGTVASASLAAGILTLNFKLGEESSIYPAPVEPPAPASSIWDRGGNVVVGNMAYTISNGDASQPSNTDPERLIYPGDLITFDVEEIEGVGGIVTKATAFGGDEQAGAREPVIGIPGIPLSLLDVHKNQDVIEIKLEGSSGERLEEFFNGGGFDEVNEVAIASVGHSAVSPVRDTYLDDITLYEIKDDGTESVIPSGDYSFDPSGVFYINSLHIGSGVGTRLAAEMWVYDTRRTLPISNMQALHDVSDTFADGFVSGGPLSSLVLQLGVKVQPLNSPEVSHYEIYDDGFGFDLATGDITWSGFDGVRFGPQRLFGQPETLIESVPSFIFERVASPLFLVGARPFPFEPGGQLNLINYDFEYAFRSPFSILSTTGGMHGSQDVRRVTANYQYRNPVHTRTFGQWTREDYEANGESPAWWDEQYTSEILDTPKLSLAVAVIELNADGDYDVLWVGTSASGDTTKTMDGSDVILSGTADITEQYKEAITLKIENANSIIAFCPGGPFQLASESSLDPKLLLQSWISEWASVMDGDLLDPPLSPARKWSSHSVDFSWVTLHDFSVFGLQIQFVNSELETGADFYAGSGEIEAAPPNLNADPIPDP